MRAALGAGLLFAACQLGGAAAAPAQVAERARAVAAIDSLARAAIDGGRVAGLSVGVVVGNDTLVLRGYGRADLELDVPTPDRAVYQIGSVTKQFTAAAVLQLWEQGRLDLDTDIGEYLPDFDTQGRRIPLRRLLDHTSGIRGYTEMPAFAEIAARALPRDSLVRMIQREPFDFEPGDALIYNNSAYFLLGLIIEEVSGQSYAEYVRQHLFEPAGMVDSHYCSNTAVVPRRAKGYAATPEGLRRADYIDHTWPYAAGSLCSTAGDAIAWTRALHGGRILGDNAYRALITPEPLAGGYGVRYAKGLSVVPAVGHPAISHGGGIPGYLSHLTYVPEHDATVVVLANSTGPVSPGGLVAAIIRILFGERPPAAAVTYPAPLDGLAGTYTGRGRGAEFRLRVVVADGALQYFVNQAQNAVRAEYIGDRRFRAGNTLLRFEEEAGRIVRVVYDQGGGVYVLAPDDARESASGG
jgi:CubicO group peptidase (beta-lactamase class C family)